MTDTSDIRVNKIKEATSKSVETQSIVPCQKKVINIDDIKLSSYSCNEEDDFLEITLKYNDCFLTTKVQDYVFKEYKLINKTNIVDIVSRKNLVIKGMLFYNIAFYVEKYSDYVVYKMDIYSVIKHSPMNISIYESLNIHFTKMTDKLSIMNERLKNFENKEEYNSIYDFFIA